MTRVGWLVVIILTVALITMSALYLDSRAGQGAVPSQAPGFAERPQRSAPTGSPGRSSEMSEAQRAEMLEQRMERTLEQAGLSDEEKAVAKKAMSAKAEARQGLSDELTELRRTANKTAPTDQELQDALAAYQAAMDEYRKTVQAEDEALMQQLSPEGQVRCMSLGIVDNALGGARMGRVGSRSPGAGGGPPGR